MRLRRKRIRTIPGREPLTDSDKRPADWSRNALAWFQHAKLRPRYGYCHDETRATKIKKKVGFLPARATHVTSPAISDNRRMKVAKKHTKSFRRQW